MTSRPQTTGDAASQGSSQTLQDNMSESAEHLRLSETSIEFQQRAKAAIENVARSADQKAIDQLYDTLMHWPEADGISKPLTHMYYPLAYDYGDLQLTPATLKPRDAAVVSALESIAASCQLVIFLALVWRKREVNGGIPHGGLYYYPGDYNDVGPDDEVIDHDTLRLVTWQETECKVRRLRDMDGQVASQNMPLDEDFWLVRPQIWDTLAQENTEGSAGHEDSKAEHWTRKAALLIVPRQYMVPVLATAWEQPNVGASDRDDRIIHQVHYFADKAMPNPRTAPSDPPQPKDSADAFRALREICHLVWYDQGRQYQPGSRPNRFLPGEASRQLLIASFKGDDPVLFEEVAAKHGGKLPLDFFDWLRRDFEAAGKGNSLTFSNAEEWNSRFQKFKAGLATAIDAYNVHSELAQALGRLLDLYGPSGSAQSSTVEMFRPFVEAVTWDLLEPWVLTVEDVEDMGFDSYLGLVDCLADPPGFLRQWFLPLLKDAEVSASLYNDVLKRLRDRTGMKMSQHQEYTDIYTEVGRLGLRDVQLHDLHSYHDVVDFVKLGVEPVAETLNNIRDATLDRLSTLDVSELTIKQLDESWIPALQALPQVLRDANVSLRDDRVQVLYRAIINAYISRYVGLLPCKADILPRVPLACTCSLCQLVSTFLLDGSVNEGRFSLDESSRSHVIEGLQNANVDCSIDELGHNIMRVVKTFGEMSGRVVEYERRRKRAWEELGRIEELKEIMGADDVEEVMGKLVTGNAAQVHGREAGEPSQKLEL